MGQRLDDINAKLKEVEQKLIKGDAERAELLAKWKEKQMQLQAENTRLQITREILIKFESFPGIGESQVQTILLDMSEVKK